MITNIICYFTGHKYKPARIYFLLARKCARCNNRQVQLPDGQWIDNKK